MEGMFQIFTSLVFTNFIPKDLPTPLIVPSKIYCAKDCVTDPNCQSFFYVTTKNTTKLCYHLSQVLANTTGLNAQDNVGYYRVHQVSGVCPTVKGYTHEPSVNVCYKIHSDSQTWTNARTACQAEGGDLIVLQSSTKDAYIRQAILDMIGTSNTDYFIGGKQTTIVGSWEWVDGTSIPGFTKSATNKRCLEIDMDVWDDDFCDSSVQPYVCEITPAERGTQI